MSKLHVSGSMAAVFGMVMLAMPVVAQVQPPMGRGMGMGMPRYDKSQEVTVKGTVEDVVQQTGRMMGGASGTHLMLKTETETLEVLVGPTRYLESHKISFKKGDEIEVTGARTTFGGNKALLAREIKMGDQVITLRNAEGIPVWARRGM
ncbi:MAG TPA: hypothetical protein VNE16_12990 [Vicinamibacterales bacterium]|nr:hypothetical protein [Vicinamibacterales bacterium]